MKWLFLLCLLVSCSPQASPAPCVEQTDYATISDGELTDYTSKHVGEYVRVAGEVFNVISDTELQMWTVSNDAVYVTLMRPMRNTYEGDEIYIKGQVGGVVSGTNAFGAAVEQPLLVCGIVLAR